KQYLKKVKSLRNGVNTQKLITNGLGKNSPV
ncbi:uncharacterized protein METZ01_LOCUS507291, partial [marine metagenome]